MSISVAMASYNGEKYIEEQIESICTQLTLEDELIISDDGSTDATISIVESLQRKNPMIKLIKGPQKGIFSNFENAIEHSKNNIIFLSDQDDVWMHNKVQTVLQGFKNEKTLLVLHDANLIVNGVESDEHLLRPYKKGVIRNVLFSSYWGCCMAFRKEFLDAYMPFAGRGVAHDQLIGLLSENMEGTLFIPDCLIKHRIHGDNKTKSVGILEKFKFRFDIYNDFKNTVNKKH